jgi:hypothetical protein
VFNTLHLMFERQYTELAIGRGSHRRRTPPTGAARRYRNSIDDDSRAVSGDFKTMPIAILRVDAMEESVESCGKLSLFGRKQTSPTCGAKTAERSSSRYRANRILGLRITHQLPRPHLVVTNATNDKHKNDGERNANDVRHARDDVCHEQLVDFVRA